jgi:colanic acid biosynthesis glycosyl transferase WcaI
LNIFIIAQYFPPDVGGASTRAYNAARGLSLQGCHVTVIAAFPHYPHGYISTKFKGRILYNEDIDSIKVVRTWVPNLAHWPIVKRILLHISFMLSSLLGFLYLRNVDVIFAMNPSLFAFFPALIYKILFRKNIIRNVDDLWPEVFYSLDIVKSRIMKRILDWAASISYRIPVAIIPVSHGYVETLIKKYHVPEEKIFVIEHGVDTSKFSQNISYSTIHDHTEKKIIMYSGALSVGYDFEIVIKTAKILASEPIHFIIRGTGELSDRLRQTVKENNIKNVEIRTDLLTQENLVSFLNSADIFLLPMSLDVVMDQGLPTKILEYQSLGKPIVCISNGEAGRYITRTQSGLATATRQPEELARLIMLLTNDDALAKKLGSNGHNNIKDNLTLEMVGKRFMDVIMIAQQTSNTNMSYRHV